MKNNLLKKLGATVAVVAVTMGLRAIPLPITGQIQFQGGTATLNTTSLATATSILSFGGATVVNNNLGAQPTGSFSGTGGAAVTFGGTPITFSPVLTADSIVNFWTFTSGLVYSFSVSSIVSNYSPGTTTLSVGGQGTLNISGGNFLPTPGIWSLTMTGNSDDAIFGFTAFTGAVPDGGMTVMLLGAALSGLALLRKKVMA